MTKPTEGKGIKTMDIRDVGKKLRELKSKRPGTNIINITSDVSEESDRICKNCNGTGITFAGNLCHLCVKGITKPVIKELETTEGKGIKKLYFISELDIDYERFLIDNHFSREQVIWVWKKETLIGRTLEEEQIYKGRGWYKVCSQDFINSRIR